MHMAHCDDQTLVVSSSAGSPRHLQMHLAVDMAETARLAAAVDDFAETADLPLDVAMQINLVLEELVTNAIKYGYPNGRTGTIHIDVDIKRTRGEIHIQVSDDGDAFDPFSAAEPDLSLDLAARPIGGLGIHLIRKLMDAYSYRYTDGRNQTTLVKRLAAAES